MDETKKTIAKKMKCFDLAGQLGKVLGVTPIWEDNCVNYELGDGLIELSFDLKYGCWLIATSEDDYGLFRLPKEAPDLMAGMSEAIEEENND